MASFKRILVPVDFSGCSKVALEHALEIARPFDSIVDVLHCWTGSPAAPSPTEPAETNLEDPDFVKNLRAFLADVQVPRNVEIRQRVEHGSPADVIIAASPSYDLVVMGTHGRTGLSRLVLGSVAERVVRMSLCPVLSVREEKITEETVKSGTHQPDLKRHPDEEIAYAVFDKPKELESAFKQLLEAGIPVDDISLLMTESAHQTDFKAIDRTQVLKTAAAGTIFGGTLGGILGGLTLLGSALTGGVGLLVMGPALALAAAGGVFGGLIGWGVPREEAQRIQAALHEGKALIAVHLHDPEKLEKAKGILRKLHGESVELD